MNYDELKEIAKEIIKKEGNTKGSELLTLKRYIEAKYGKEGLGKLEMVLEKIGCPIKFRKIKAASWYPEAFNVIAMLAAKELFHWPDLFEFGYNSPGFSFGVKVFIKFLPLHLFLKEAGKNWKKFLDVGEIEISEFNEKEKFVIISLKNYQFHPEMCRYYEGFFLRLGQYVIPTEEIKIKETKCVYKGDDCHEFFISWK